MTKSEELQEQTAQLEAAVAEYEEATARMHRAHADRGAILDALPKGDYKRVDSEDGTFNAFEKQTGITVSILPDAEDRILTHERTRRPIGGNGLLTSLLKCRLGDVWVYIVGTHIVLTKQKLHIEDLT